jgi:hypothetical protein
MNIIVKDADGNELAVLVIHFTNGDMPTAWFLCADQEGKLSMKMYNEVTLDHNKMRQQAMFIDTIKAGVNLGGP